MIQVEKIDVLTPELKSTFVNPGEIVQKVLPRGQVLWRVIPTQKSKIFSDFWMDAKTMSEIMAIIHSKGDFSNSTKVEYFMQSLGILYKWGKDRRKEKAGDDRLKLDRLDKWISELWKCKVVLKKDVVAYIGTTAPQKGLDEKGNEIEFKVGGKTQIVIPRFKNIDNFEARAWAEISAPVQI